MTPSSTKNLMLQNREYWQIPFMDFVDAFRRNKDVPQLQPISQNHEQFDALIASAIEYLCNESHYPPPDWVYNIPACREPWFVAGVESLKAIAIVESPVWFRRRKIFVLENFLKRV
ncbi:MAG: hypothetical protein JW913_09475 [Chitinispirillaceae bacterium]|nr:hypothetical protein [Chitinispirillaceae bacterium]